MRQSPVLPFKDSFYVGIRLLLMKFKLIRGNQKPPIRLQIDFLVICHFPVSQRASCQSGAGEPGSPVPSAWPGTRGGSNCRPCGLGRPPEPSSPPGPRPPSPLVELHDRWVRTHDPLVANRGTSSRSRSVTWEPGDQPALPRRAHVTQGPEETRPPPPDCPA